MTGAEVVLQLLMVSAPASPPAPSNDQGLRPRVVCSLPHATRTKFVSPVYPQTAVKAGKSGQVVLEMVITKTGKTARVRVRKGVDRDLDQAAVDAVTQWEYRPLLVDGKPLDLVLSVTVKFELPRDKTPR